MLYISILYYFCIYIFFNLPQKNIFRILIFFYSNVIEKCVVHSTPEERSFLISEVLGNYTYEYVYDF